MNLFFDGMWGMFEQHQTLVLLFGLLFLYYDMHNLKKNLSKIDKRLDVMLKCPVHEQFIDNMVERMDGFEINLDESIEKMETDMGEFSNRINTVQIGVSKIDSVLESLRQINTQLHEIFDRMRKLEDSISNMRGTCNERGKHCPALKGTGS